MSGTRPTFLTGANAKLKLNGKTLAFCQDFTCSIEVLTKTPKVLGKYEADSVEPLSYLVSGSFSVVRYAKGIKQALGGGLFPNSLAENDAGNGVGNWGTAWGGKLGDILARNGIGNDGRAHEALDPSKFAAGTTFDIQVYQKVDSSQNGSIGGGGISDTIATATGILNGTNFNSGPGNTPNVNYLGIMNVRNARITRDDFGIQKKGAVIEKFTFVAIYVDGDAYVANASGQT